MKNVFAGHVRKANIEMLAALETLAVLDCVARWCPKMDTSRPSEICVNVG